MPQQHRMFFAVLTLSELLLLGAGAVAIFPFTKGLDRNVAANQMVHARISISLTPVKLGQ